MAWTNIEKDFIATSQSSIFKDKDCLKRFYDNRKRKARKIKGIERQERIKTGEGTEIKIILDAGDQLLDAVEDIRFANVSTILYDEASQDNLITKQFKKVNDPRQSKDPTLRPISINNMKTGEGNSNIIFKFEDELMQKARFQQKQMEEKEQKLLKLYESQQQRAFDRVGRSSAGSNTSNASSTSLGSTGGGKVRAMFDERRNKAGVDKSYPLKPIESRTNGRSVSLGRQSNTNTKTVVKATTRKSVSHVIQKGNNKPISSRKEMVHQEVYNNNYKTEPYLPDENSDQKPHGVLEHKNSTTSLVNLLNNHNLNDILDNQNLPDEVDFHENYKSQPLYMSGKLANVGGKLPSQIQKETVKTSQNGVSSRNNGNGKLSSEIKTAAVPTPVKPKPAPRTPSSAGFIECLAPRSPVKENMSTKQTPSSQRAPLNSRPSAKQSAKSAVVRDDLAACRYCERRFATDRLEKHEQICGKTAKKKRKAYDSTKHRVIGTELEGYVLRGPKKGAAGAKMPAKASTTSSKTNWRRTHEEFIAAIRAAKQAQAYVAKGGKLSDLPPPPPASNPDYVQCPHCGRRFNETAAQRHIPKCATFEFNKPKGGTSKTGKR